MRTCPRPETFIDLADGRPARSPSFPFHRFALGAFPMPQLPSVHASNRNKVPTGSAFGRLYLKIDASLRVALRLLIQAQRAGADCGSAVALVDTAQALWEGSSPEGFGDSFNRNIRFCKSTDVQTTFKTSIRRAR
jgi:hypothetical protein